MLAWLLGARCYVRPPPYDSKAYGRGFAPYWTTALVPFPAARTRARCPVVGSLGLAVPILDAVGICPSLLLGCHPPFSRCAFQASAHSVPPPSAFLLPPLSFTTRRTRGTLVFPTQGGADDALSTPPVRNVYAYRQCQSRDTECRALQEDRAEGETGQDEDKELQSWSLPAVRCTPTMKNKKRRRANDTQYVPSPTPMPGLFAVSPRRLAFPQCSLPVFFHPRLPLPPIALPLPAGSCYLQDAASHHHVVRRRSVSWSGWWKEDGVEADEDRDTCSSQDRAPCSQQPPRWTYSLAPSPRLTTVPSSALRLHVALLPLSTISHFFASPSPYDHGRRIARRSRAPACTIYSTYRARSSFFTSEASPLAVDLQLRSTPPIHLCFSAVHSVPATHPRGDLAAEAIDMASLASRDTAPARSRSGSRSVAYSQSVSHRAHRPLMSISVSALFTDDSLLPVSVSGPEGTNPSPGRICREASPLKLPIRLRASLARCDTVPARDAEFLEWVPPLAMLAVSFRVVPAALAPVSPALDAKAAFAFAVQRLRTPELRGRGRWPVASFIEPLGFVISS
ncbi:hypothetical protein R3P38DRAFT_3176507 [Favolaschia claudopus]|uniref:Uncharacterized protein n=1 Tax=Favolaschia claudopus TaxID=2862362 RepID=A0AAW0D7F1_9AGAR